ncbi:hypothetical protein [Acidithiobacillus sulfuriphilus]|uniref:Uncharacterized protein n=2 Tax=Acidithiobacillus sulfuriphilus TaxID=1867749 RepID=A0A3M8QUS2_9PROT|nr:hypothetical protein [Acidithiobacillus sulfuriphilus]MCL5980066.1 hypothetical protein [Gammaproteobacteria bacterium]RNF59947.1 hypothetical protein EC580_09885 [Acidithiobacillus sulfuriphilus]
MSTIEKTAFGKLDVDKRLQNPVFKDWTKKPGRFGFRGEIALKFAPNIADEARPPEIVAAQTIAVAEEGKPGIDFLACYLLSFAYLKSLVDALRGILVPGGKYFLFCNNIDLNKRYQVTYEGVSFYILPIDEATVYNETLELFYIERNDLKKLDTAGKTDRMADAALRYAAVFPEISYEEGLSLMGPVRDPGANRPV